ncbi:helix-turn-helix domain-containing protein [bacterium]|nr:helix-turn-helix domain-containing protein [bacterium]
MANDKSIQIPTQSEYLTVRETALFENSSVKSVYRQVWNRELDFIKLGRKILIPRSSIESFMARHTTTAFDKGTIHDVTSGI